MMKKIEKLKEGVALACQPQGATLIVKGREIVCAMEKSFVIANIEAVANKCLNFDDYWEFRRFLELCELLDNDLTKRIAEIGLSSTDPDVLEASNDFL